MKRYNFKSLENARDLGGYPLPSGGYTIYHRFMRSDVPIHLTHEEINLLSSYKITTVVDLRSSVEAAKHVCYLSGAPGFSYFHFPLSGDGIFPNTVDDIPASYFDMTARESEFLGIMNTFANAPGGVLFHCSAGKDRTGVVAALLLALVGVPVPDIIADYQVSATYLQEKIRNTLETDLSLPAWLGKSQPEYLEKFFDLFFNKYESAESFLLSIGVSNSDIQKIKLKLICT